MKLRYFLITLKAIHIMPTLPLQKPRRKSKVRDHLIALEKRLKLWDERNVEEFLDESKETQEMLPFTPQCICKNSSFLDARVFDPNAIRYFKSVLLKCYAQNQKGKVAVQREGFTN